MSRIYYSKDFKRKALIEVTSGKKLEDILKANSFDIENLLKKDKKYCSKLLYKWRKEIYNDSELLNLTNVKLTLSSIEKEIDNLEYNSEADIVMLNAKKKLLKGVNRYKNLKKHVLLSNLKIKNK